MIDNSAKYDVSKFTELIKQFTIKNGKVVEKEKGTADKEELLLRLFQSYLYLSVNPMIETYLVMSVKKREQDKFISELNFANYDQLDEQKKAFELISKHREEAVKLIETLVQYEKYIKIDNVIEGYEIKEDMALFESFIP
mgnify:CR=1 FL=1